MAKAKDKTESYIKRQLEKSLRIVEKLKKELRKFIKEEARR